MVNSPCITLQSNTDDDNFYFMYILRLGIKSPQSTRKSHSGAHSVLESGFGLMQEAGLALSLQMCTQVLDPGQGKRTWMTCYSIPLYFGLKMCYASICR